MATHLTHISALDSTNLTLKEAYTNFFELSQIKFPFLIWLLENPHSPIPFPGKVNLYNHDCLHLLLDLGISSQDEAFIIGLTMGNDSNTNWFHLIIYKFFARFFYPHPYKFSPLEIKLFNLGFNYGRKLKVKQIHQIDFRVYQNDFLADLRKKFGINLAEIPLNKL